MVHKRSKNQSSKLKNTLASVLRNHSKPIYALLTTMLFIFSCSLISAAAFAVWSPNNTPALAGQQVLVAPATIAGTSQSHVSSSAPEQSLGFQPQFDVQVIYTYAGKGNASSIVSPFPNGPFKGLPLYPISLYPSIIYFNLTNIANTKNESCDAKLEVYQVKIASDKGSEENYAFYVGTNYSPSFSNLSALAPAISRVNDLIDSNTNERTWGYFTFNWTTNQSIIKYKLGSDGFYASTPSGLGLWGNGQPNTITVTIRRTGCITLNGTSASTTSAPTGNVVQLQLEKYGDGFLHNKLVPENELLTTNLFQPLK